MAAYRFSTTWLLDAPRERVWDAIYDAVRPPEWWRGVARFEFEILRNERPNLLVGRASGELCGEGVWRMYEGALGSASTWPLLAAS